MIDKYITKIKNSNFIKSILTLSSGNIIAYAINILLLPILSRIYGPDNIGEYDLIISTSKFVLNIFSLGLIIGVMLPKDDEKAQDICKTVRLLNFIFVFLSIIILFIISRWYKIFEISINYYLSVLLLGLYIILYNQNDLFIAFTNRRKLYRVLFWNSIILSAGNFVLSLIFGYLGLGTLGYFMGTLVSLFLNISYMRFYVNPYLGVFSSKKLINTIKEFKAIPLFQMPANFIGMISNELPLQFLGRVFSSSVLGSYTMACRILSMPVGLLVTPINRVFFKEISERKNNGQPIGDLTCKIITKNIKFIVPPVFLLMLFGEPILGFFLGDAWKGTGKYLSIIGLVYVLKFCSSCVANIFVVLSMQKLNLLLSSISCALYLLCCILLLYLNFSVEQAIYCFAIIDIINNVLNIGLIVYFSGGSVKRLLKLIVFLLISGTLAVYILKFQMLK